MSTGGRKRGRAHKLSRGGGADKSKDAETPLLFSYLLDYTGDRRPGPGGSQSNGLIVSSPRLLFLD